MPRSAKAASAGQTSGSTHIIFGPDNAHLMDQFIRSTAHAQTRATRINVGLRSIADVRKMIDGSYVPADASVCSKLRVRTLGSFD
jgi:hypothetical protein